MCGGGVDVGCQLGGGGGRHQKILYKGDMYQAHVKKQNRF